MRLFWKIFRAVVSVLLLLAVLLPAAIYVLLSIDGVQDMVRRATEDSLSKLLRAEVRVGSVAIHPFNRATVGDIALISEADTIARVSTVSAGFEIWPLISAREVVVDYALLDGVDIHITRATPSSPLNIEPIIERLRSDNPGGNSAVDIEVSSVVIRRANARYDVLSEPEADDGRFDPNHIAVNNLAVNAFIPHISKDNYRATLDHLSFDERSGFVLEKLSGSLALTPDILKVSDLRIQLPGTSLALAPVVVDIDSNLADALRNNGSDVATLEPAIIYPPDFKAFMPIAGEIDVPLELNLAAHASTRNVTIERFDLTDRHAVDITLRGTATDIDDREAFSFDIPQGTVNIDGRALVSDFGMLIDKKTGSVVKRCERLSLLLEASGNLTRGQATLQSDGTLGKIDIDAAYRRRGNMLNASIAAAIADFNLGLLTDNAHLDLVDAEIDVDGNFHRRVSSAGATVKVSRFDFNGTSYSKINLDGEYTAGRNIELNLNIDDPALRTKAYALYTIDKETPTFDATAALYGIDLHAMGLDPGHEGYRLSGKLNVLADNADFRQLSGRLDLSDVAWVDGDGQGFTMNRLTATALPDGVQPELRIESPVVEGFLKGTYDFTTLGRTLHETARIFLPVLDARAKPRGKHGNHRVRPNNFHFDLTLKPASSLCHMLGLPVEYPDDVTLTGRVDDNTGYASVNLNAPYLIQGQKIIENTHVFGLLDPTQSHAMVYGTTQYPTKKGDMAVAFTLKAKDNVIGSHIDWEIIRTIPLNGHIDFDIALHSLHSPAGSAFPLTATMEMRPGSINFGDETWQIEPGTLAMLPDKLVVDNFALDTGSQRIDITGTIGTDNDNIVAVDLANVSLLPIFETLEIDKALIGGRASGHFNASHLLSQEPRIICPLLHVDSIGYNRCTIGNADITALWDNSNKGVYLDADITGFENKKSRIDGYIFPMTESLDINFDADSVPVQFLKPFMDAFTSDISGRASGKCRLFGTFKEIDLEGDIFADNVKLKIDFTNTSYTATDSVHIRPGSIKLDNIIIRDTEGHTARLSGTVGHTFFKAPTFDFRVTDARNFLSYNVTSRQNPDWYGTIYGNGGATISGYPGVVNIGVDMATAPGSTFTFVLSDRLDAEDYSFLTFRDVTPDSLRVPQKHLDDTPEIVRLLKDGLNQNSDDRPSDYNMDIAVNITPDARISLVMDPAGGDEIKAVGNGTMRMLYQSANNDLGIWGKYIVQSGSYRFTLQDIIIKDFTIKEGSEIQFDGDPYGVKTTLSAYYATNANLSDLDESFLQDKEVARTNVPVHAVMNVDGDIRQPSISFDLEFPTLTQDTYRKVRSIVSTDDMMNRQIIYLLALNRFYTPDYMNTTKGSELFSVASSTIAGQLGNMLGKLSDNWSIAPNLRSDRGDFSDVEVDLALNSRLLNNRLIFNGNFGYRDKALNNNQFIGDFDIEYLLNKRGTWRLKAYNRYNDRNYYVRTAQTTQGVGIMFRRDFDSFLSFLRKKKKKTETVSTESNDTTSTTPNSPQ